MSKPTRKEIVMLGRQVFNEKYISLLPFKRSKQDIIRGLDLASEFNRKCGEYFGLNIDELDKDGKEELQSIIDEIKSTIKFVDKVSVNYV